jgi:hypothetical protein
MQHIDRRHAELLAQRAQSPDRDPHLLPDVVRVDRQAEPRHARMIDPFE